MIFGSSSRRRLRLFGRGCVLVGRHRQYARRLSFRRCGRVVSGLALPVGMTYSKPGSRLHGLGDPAEELCATTPLKSQRH
jgi:hypothetical protein